MSFFIRIAPAVAACCVVLTACSKSREPARPLPSADDRNAGEVGGSLTKAQGGMNGDSDYCNDPAAPCTVNPNEGDCDFDWHCTGGADPVCGANNGARFGFSSNTDVCWERHCQNNIRDGNELDVDCGGDCGACVIPDAGVPDSGVPPDAGASCLCPADEATITDTWASSPNDYWAVGTRPSGEGVVYHYDGTAWSVASSDFAETSENAGGALNVVNGTMIGPNQSMIFAIGPDYFGQGIYDGTNTVFTWKYPDFSSCAAPNDVWIGPDGARVTFGVSSVAHPRLQFGWCNDGMEDIELDPPNPMPSPDEWIGECRAPLFDWLTTYASWDPSSVAVQREVRARCEAVRGFRCSPDPDDDWCHEPHELNADSDEVWAYSGGNWVALYNARLVGTPCGALTAYASVGPDLYSFDEFMQRWVLSNNDWVLVQSAQFCQTSFPPVPMPACNCP